MGASNSKKKKNKTSGGSFLGGLADAAEGATSSITKAIEDTSAQVTSSIDTTTKSVTSAIDDTAKRLSGTAEDFNQRAGAAADDATTAADSLKDIIDQTAKNAGDSSKKAINDMKDKADATSTSIKEQVDKTKDDIEKTGKAVTDSIKTSSEKAATSAIEKADKTQRDAEELASILKDVAKGKAAQLKNAADETAEQVKAAGEGLKNEAENTANKACSKGESALAQARSSVEDTASQIKSSGESLKKDVEAKAQEATAKAEETASHLKKTSEETASNIKNNIESLKKEAEMKANEAKATAEGTANEAKAKAESTANQLKNAAKETASQVKSTGESLKQEAEDKAREARSRAEEAAESLRSTAKNKAKEAQAGADSAIGSLQSNISSTSAAAKSQAEQVKDQLTMTASETKKQAESTISGVKGTVESTTAEIKSTYTSVIDDTKMSAQQVSDSINHSLVDATDKVKNEGESVKSNLTGLVDSTTGMLKETAENVTDALKTTMTAAVGGAVNAAAGVAKKTVTDVSSSVNKAAEGVTHSLTGAVHNVSSSVQGAAGAAVGGLLGKAASLTGALAQGAEDVSKAADRYTIGTEDRSSFTVCKEDEMKDGEMKVFKLCDEGSVLIVKENGEFSALGTKCSHYGAPLVKGVLHDGKIRCPWHGACFNTATGDIEESPGLDSIPCYEVLVEDGEVKVLASADVLKNNMRIKPLCQKKSGNSQTFVIIGGGGAGQACVDTLRHEGFTGRLVFISKESDLPYDRPKLSKALTSTGKDIALRSEEFFQGCDIEVLLGNEVVSVDTDGKTVTCENENQISYDCLMIATGGCPITLDVPGCELDNVCYLRTPENANQISSEARDKNAVIIGTSFIGMEVAAYLHGKAKSVVVVGRSKTPFANAFGEKVGERFKQLFTDKGIKFQFETEVEEFLGDNGKLKTVVLKNGEKLHADICIIGIGVQPATKFLADSGLKLNNRKLIEVNEHLKTSVDSVYAAGDIVQFPLTLFSSESVNIGHWQMAQTQGRTAALNMLGKDKPLHTVPFFWTAMFGKSLRYSGYGQGADDFIIDGDVDAMKFVLYCCKGDKVVAVAAMGMDPVASQFASFVAGGGVLKKSEIQADPSAWISALA